MHGLMITKMKATILRLEQELEQANETWEREYPKLEARASQAWETCQKAVERGMMLEREVERLEVDNLRLRMELITALAPDWIGEGEE